MDLEDFPTVSLPVCGAEFVREIVYACPFPFQPGDTSFFSHSSCRVP